VHTRLAGHSTAAISCNIRKSYGTRQCQSYLIPATEFTGISSGPTEVSNGSTNRGRACPSTVLYGFLHDWMTQVTDKCQGQRVLSGVEPFIQPPVTLPHAPLTEQPLVLPFCKHICAWRQWGFPRRTSSWDKEHSRNSYVLRKIHAHGEQRSQDEVLSFCSPSKAFVLSCQQSLIGACLGKYPYPMWTCHDLLRLVRSRRRSLQFPILLFYFL
jgi:hypothetical protein